MKGGDRVRDIAVLLPIGALVLFLPPYVRLFDQPETVGGMPLLPLAIFAFWLLGIVFTGLTARALRRQEERPADDATRPGGAQRRSDDGPG